MFRAILILKAAPEQAEALIDHYAQYEVMAEGIRQAGGLECELCIAEDNPGDMAVISLWPSREAHQLWLDHPVRARITAPISHMMPEAHGRVYRVEDRVSRASLGLE